MLAEGKTWTKKGPFNLGVLSKPFAIISVLGGLLLFFIGVQPPNSALITYTIVLLVIMAVLWFGVARQQVPGPADRRRHRQAPGRDRGRGKGGGRSLDLAHIETGKGASAPFPFAPCPV